VPIDAAGRHAAELLIHATLKVHAGAPHGLVGDHRAAFEAELLEFLTR
jgi:non-heme chloroperoxidase